VQLSHCFALSYDYEGYFADSAGTGYSRCLAQVSLKWVSNSGMMGFRAKIRILTLDVARYERGESGIVVRFEA
jgi:hypothetical protein